MSIPEKLLDFAFCHMSNYGNLANLAADENWGEGNCILMNYLKHLYKRIAHLDSKCEQAGVPNPHLYMNEDVACFDTGLYTDRYESIYALFAWNVREDAAQDWFLKGFYKTSDPALRDIDELPQRVRFSDDPADLVYDYRYRIRVNIDHILGDENNLSRVPAALQGAGNSMLLHRVFEGAVIEAERRAAANYMLAVPQYFNGRIQLLLPLCLTGNEPELALAIQREDGYYSARTCLTLEMAYNNARLIARPEAAWIRPHAADVTQAVDE